MVKGFPCGLEYRQPSVGAREFNSLPMRHYGPLRSESLHDTEFEIPRVRYKKVHRSILFFLPACYRLTDHLRKADRFSAPRLAVIFVDFITVAHERTGISDKLPPD
jgi:hypothetical protein